LIGFSISALALLWTWLRASSSGRLQRRWVTGFLEMAATAGILLTGLRYASGHTPRGALLGGALTGLALATVMALLLGLNRAHAYRFRRPAWDFSQAWTRAGHAPPASAFNPAHHRDSRARLRILEHFRADWQTNHPDQPPADYIAQHHQEIREALTRPRTAPQNPPTPPPPR
ncbi:MAG TPA: hypothetical protein VH134_12540, partial [Candidatus Dormibacteraeota bacterium]|nr:hypothetical protein [Candidatus Dormibacteraeota bacterium]